MQTLVSFCMLKSNQEITKKSKMVLQYVHYMQIIFFENKSFLNISLEDHTI